MAVVRIFKHGEWRWTLKRPTVPMKNVFWSFGFKVFVIPLCAAQLAGIFAIENVGLMALYVPALAALRCRVHHFLRISAANFVSWMQAVELNIRVLRVALKPLNRNKYKRIKVLLFHFFLSPVLISDL